VYHLQLRIAKTVYGADTHHGRRPTACTGTCWRLTNAGYDIVLSASATQAKSKLRLWDFDVLLTDLVVRKDGRPGPDGGLGLIGWVRHMESSNPGLPFIPIIAMSGEQTSGVRDILLPTANRIGANLVLEKPVDLPELLSVIETLTQSKANILSA